MSKCIYGNTVGVSGLPKSYVLETEDGTQKLIGVLVGEETVFDATDNDVREGKIYASDSGVSTGTKIIPAYHTSQGVKIISNGSPVVIPNILPSINSYDYTKMQAIVCLYNSTLVNSVSAQQVSIDNNIYDVQSTEVVSSVAKNHDLKIVEFGVTNTTGAPLIIRFLMYKEIE